MSDELNSLKVRVGELEEFNKLAQSLSSLTSVQGTLEAIGDFCLKVCHAEKVAIVLRDPASDQEVHTLVRSLSPGDKAIDHRINTFVSGWVDRNKRALRTDDLAEALKVQDSVARSLNLGSGLAVPMVVDGNVIGFINMVNSRGGVSFAGEDERMASAIAPLAAQFIIRCRVHDSLQEDIRQLKTTLAIEQASSRILGTSKPIQRVLSEIALVAPTSANVLIIGETGTGKELTARAIHRQSARATRPFVPLNCAAIPADLFESELFGHERGAFTGASAVRVGIFELAHGGTLFLDEISEMPLGLQPKLLRVLEEKRFSRVGSSQSIQIDVRIIAASSKDLEGAMRAREFREALYHRLNVVPINLPPLRDRKEDIPILAQEFVKEFSGGAKSLSADALAVLTSLTWKGNVRELRNAIERAAIMIPFREIDVADLKSLGISTTGESGTNIQSLLGGLIDSNEQGSDLTELMERQLVELALNRAGGNISQASRLLGVERKTLERRMEKYDLKNVRD